MSKHPPRSAVTYDEEDLRIVEQARLEFPTLLGPIHWTVSREVNHTRARFHAQDVVNRRVSGVTPEMIDDIANAYLDLVEQLQKVRDAKAVLDSATP